MKKSERLKIANRLIAILDLSDFDVRQIVGLPPITGQSGGSSKDRRRARRAAERAGGKKKS